MSTYIKMDLREYNKKVRQLVNKWIKRNSNQIKIKKELLITEDYAPTIIFLFFLSQFWRMIDVLTSLDYILRR